MLISIPLAFFVVPRASMGGDEPSFEGFANLFPHMRSSAGLVGVAAFFLILAFPRALLGLLFSAAIYLILVRILVQPTNTDVYATLSAISYTSVVELLTRVLLIGLLARVYDLYLTFVGIQEMHETTTGRTLAVVALLVVLFVVFDALPLFPQGHSCLDLASPG